MLLCCSCQHVAHIACCCPLKVMPSMANSKKHTSKALPSSRVTRHNSSTQANRATHHSSRLTVSYPLSNRDTYFSCRRHCRLSLATPRFFFFVFFFWLLNNSSWASWWFLPLGNVTVPDACQDIIKSKELKDHLNEWLGDWSLVEEKFNQ